MVVKSRNSQLPCDGKFLMIFFETKVFRFKPANCLFITIECKSCLDKAFITYIHSTITINYGSHVSLVLWVSHQERTVQGLNEVTSYPVLLH